MPSSETPLVNARKDDASAPPLRGAIDIASGRSLRDEVHQRLRDAILNARLLPGASLSENEIVNMLQVSRTPIREALQRLSNEGLIYVVPQVGTFVTRMDLARIREALFVREAVECAAFDRLPRPLTKEKIQALQRNVMEHRAAIRASDVTGILLADDTFHRSLLEMAGLPGAWRYVQEAREMHRRVRVLARTEYDSARRSVRQHGAVVAELAAGRTRQAAELLREHIRMNVSFAEDMSRSHPEYFTSDFRERRIRKPTRATRP